MMLEDCPTYIGNSDAYGLGIRLGIYLQWATSVINKWVFADRDHLRDVLNENAIFLLSIFIATIILAATGDPKPHAADIIILEHIFFGSIYTVFFDGHIIDNLERISSFWGILFKWAMPVGMAALSVWFWTHGLDELEQTCGGTKGFLFAPVDVLGGVKKAFIFFACLNLLIWTSALVGTMNDRMFHLAMVFGLSRRNERVPADAKHEKPRGFTRFWEEVCMPMKESTTEEISGLNTFRDIVRENLLMKERVRSETADAYSTAVAYRELREQLRQRPRHGMLSTCIKFFDKLLPFFEGLESSVSFMETWPQREREFLLGLTGLLVNMLGDQRESPSLMTNKKSHLPGRIFLAQIISAFNLKLADPENSTSKK